MLKTARVAVHMKHALPSALRLYAVALNGERMERLPLEKLDDGVRFILDTSKLKHGPTTFFELVDEGGLSDKGTLKEAA